MGLEPDEKDTPPEIEDFPDIAQQSLLIYNCLSDCWDTMGGNYLGKDFGILFQLCELFEVDKESQKLCFKLIQHLDNCRAEIISIRLKAKESSKPSDKS